MTPLGKRVGAFVLFSDDDCRRHAVRLGSVLALSDVDNDQESTMMLMPGNRSVLIRSPLDEVLSWFT